MTDSLKYISVLLPLNLRDFYTYSVPVSINIQIGDFVLVSFNHKNQIGIVIDFITFDTLPNFKIKDILQKDDSITPLHPTMLIFMKMFASYNLTSLGKVFNLTLHKEIFKKIPTDIFYKLSNKNNLSKKITKKQLSLIEYIADSQKSITDLKHNNFTVNYLNKQVDLGLLITYKQAKEYQQIDYNYKQAELNEEQKKVTQDLFQEISKDIFSVNLLEGVTGSGKTEVYFELINKMLTNKKQALIMLPEIALTSQIIDRFKKRFSFTPSIWHSSLSESYKANLWHQINNNQIQVLIGTRSSLFLPFKNLGLIIIDEEHESSYKQEEKVFYNARDMAILRAKLFNHPLLLCSATPSSETFYNVFNNKYNYYQLSTRFNNQVLPPINIIDLKKESLLKNNYISLTLQKEIKETLDKNQQVLLFVNKRGYASVNLCKACGTKIVCKNCAISLVEHRTKNTLNCHYCGYSIPKKNDCEKCLSKDSIISYGLGIEKVAEEITNIFPKYPPLIISSDTIKNKKQAEQFINSITNKEYHIIIGTQMIAKGYHFPDITLVGIIDGDLGVIGSDLKGSERFWQTLYQVAGRAGRGDLSGKVFIQAYDTESFLLKTLKNYNQHNFIKEELQLKESAQIPPYTRFISMILSSKNENILNKFCNSLLTLFVKNLNNEITILGPTDSILYFLQNNYRKRFLFKAKRSYNLQNYLKKILDEIEIPTYIKIQIDVDSTSFY
jgi:primosomal protein N' (replication factor Y)